MKLNVPFYTQYADDVPQEWRARACGIAVLKMALAYQHRASGEEIPSIRQLIEEGVASGGYMDSVGWRHDALVLIANKYGVHAYRKEYKDDKRGGIEELKQALKQETVPAVSVSTNHNNASTFHLVALTGYDGDGFSYNDPARNVEEGKSKYISYADFERLWRGLVIFYPK